jgi:hypothetical protein
MDTLLQTPIPAMTTTLVVCTAGSTTTLTSTNQMDYCIGGRAYTEATASNEATPTEDWTKGANSTFTDIVAGQGTVYVFGRDSATTLRCSQGDIEALDSSGAFITAPQLPRFNRSVLAPDVAPHCILIVKGGSTLVAGWRVGDDAMTGVTGMTYTFISVMTLLDRPVVA